jgi:hypothetical protein
MIYADSIIEGWEVDAENPLLLKAKEVVVWGRPDYCRRRWGGGYAAQRYVFGSLNYNTSVPIPIAVPFLQCQ